MPKMMQNIVFLMEPPEEEYDTSLKAGNMYLNRFCIDEDAAVELSGVYDLKKPSYKSIDWIRKAILGRTAKGKVNYS